MKASRILIIVLVLGIQSGCDNYSTHELELTDESISLPLVGRLNKVNYQGLQLDVRVIINKGMATESTYSMTNLKINNGGISGELKMDLQDGVYNFDIEYELQNSQTTAVVATIATQPATIVKDSVNTVELNTATLEYPDTDGDSVDNLDEMLLEQDPNTLNPVDTVYYTLQSVFAAEINECFEANAIVNTVPEGPARMTTCDNANTRQSWKLAATASPGYYKLLTQFNEGEQETNAKLYCLEGNEPVAGASINGNSHITNCGVPAGGQLWKIVNVEPGIFTLVTAAQESKNFCLESNRSDRDVNNFAAYMSECVPYTGQLWFAQPR